MTTFVYLQLLVILRLQPKDLSKPDSSHLSFTHGSE